MTNFENLKNMNIDEFAEWIKDHGQFDSSPWMEWFDTNYCKKCKPIMYHNKNSTIEFPVSWCELNKECVFFPDMKQAPGLKDIIKMWLELEV